MKLSRLSAFEKNARTDSALEYEGDQWEHGQIGLYKRSYDALGDAFSSIFESVYLLAATMPSAPKDGDAATFESLKNRYVTVYKYDEKTSHLEIEICPTNISGVVEPYMAAAPEMQTALMSLSEDLMEHTAGIIGVKIHAGRLGATLRGPQPFLEMLIALCAGKGIGSSESVHDAYVAEDAAFAEERAKPGHYGFMPLDKKPPQEYEDVRAGLHYKRLYANSNDVVAIPKLVFASMAMQPYGYQEIGRLLNDFNKRAVYPLLSLQALEATVQQDIAGTTTLPQNAAFNIH